MPPVVALHAALRERCHGTRSVARSRTDPRRTAVQCHECHGVFVKKSQCHAPDKLREAGVHVDYVNYDGVTHEFFGMGAVVDKAKQAVAKAAECMKPGFQNQVR